MKPLWDSVVWLLNAGALICKTKKNKKIVRLPKLISMKTLWRLTQKLGVLPIATEGEREKRKDLQFAFCGWNLEYFTCERGYFIKVLYRVYIVFGIPYDATHVQGYVEFSLESDFIIIVVFDLKFIPTCLVEKIRYNKFHFLFVCISRWVMIFE